MKAYARHYILKTIALSARWGYTPLSSKIEKDYAYQCRSEKLLVYTQGAHVPAAFYDRRPNGPERIANWWALTLKGFSYLNHLYNGDNYIDNMKYILFSRIFTNTDVSVAKIKDIVTRSGIV